MVIARALATLVMILPMLSATSAYAQIASTKPYASLFLIRSLDPADTPAIRTAMPLTAAVAAATPVAAAHETPVKGTPRGIQPSLYAGLVTLQALDTHSTLRAVDSGHVEQNPLMRWSVDHPVALVSMKAAASAATILVAERIRKRHPARAVAFMAVLNTAYALVVLHNYRVSAHH
jgi:hypothetical protein